MFFILKFFTPTIAIDLECQFAEEIYNCALIQVFNEETAEVFEVMGYHSYGKKNADVVGLSLSVHVLSTFPSGIDNFFPNLKYFWWNKGKLKSISSQNLKQFRKLEELSLERNQLKTLESDLFKHNPNLQYLYLKWNPIKSIGENLLIGLKQLRVADFTNNECLSYIALQRSELEELKRRIWSDCPLNIMT